MQDLTPAPCISPAAKHVLRFIPHDPVDSTLDVGTGCGILALVTAPFSREVVATDLNPRAEQFVAFNAALNGFDNIRFLAGNGLQPVADRRFDLIVSNPPFVLAPSKRFMYRDSGMALDAFCRRLAREAPALLREGGRFQMILEWVRIGEQPWQERLQDWFRDSGCDAWVLMDYAEAPDRYALTRLRETPPALVEADVATYSEWLEYYREHNVSWIQGGILTLRKRGDVDNWVFLEKLPGNTNWPVNEEITRGFRVRDLLAEEDEARLLDSRLRLRPDARLERSYGAGDDGWQGSELTLKSEQGFPHRVGMTDDIAQFLARFDGRHTVREVIDELAGRVKTPAAQVRDEALSMVQRMLLLGFLWIGG